jgi:DNA-binding MarR family transcriptional regulator
MMRLDNGMAIETVPMRTQSLDFLVQPLEHLRDQDSAMEVSTALVFIRVVLQPGIKKTEIERQLNLTRSAAHRHIALLTEEGDVSRRGSQSRGLGLVIRKPDPQDGRAKRLYLTRKGQAFAQSLGSYIDRKYLKGP